MQTKSEEFPEKIGYYASKHRQILNVSMPSGSR
jgi:hypothetical protein